MSQPNKPKNTAAKPESVAAVVEVRYLEGVKPDPVFIPDLSSKQFIKYAKQDLPKKGSAPTTTKPRS